MDNANNEGERMQQDGSSIAFTPFCVCDFRRSKNIENNQDDEPSDWNRKVLDGRFRISEEGYGRSYESGVSWLSIHVILLPALCYTAETWAYVTTSRRLRDDTERSRRVSWGTTSKLNIEQVFVILIWGVSLFVIQWIRGRGEASWTSRIVRRTSYRWTLRVFE